MKQVRFRLGGESYISLLPESPFVGRILNTGECTQPPLGSKQQLAIFTQQAEHKIQLNGETNTAIKPTKWMKALSQINKSNKPNFQSQRTYKLGNHNLLLCKQQH